jgi:hypothetical protein
MKKPKRIELVDKVRGAPLAAIGLAEVAAPVMVDLRRWAQNKK